MNEHVPQAIREKWKAQYEFVGIPFETGGKRYMRAVCKGWPFKGHTHFYSFQDDMFWHDRPSGVEK
jgi:hypothetical protein